MILVDYRERAPKRPGREHQEQHQFTTLLKRLRLEAQEADLPYGDFAFDGVWQGSPVCVGVERKRVHDMLRCIDDSRYNETQRVGMARLYDISYLIVEGYFKAHDPYGHLMESHDGCHWYDCRPGGQRVMYHKLRRYLFSVQHSGVYVLFSKDMFQTAYDIHELYHYYQKRKHTSMLQMQTYNIPSLNGKPSLTRRWAFSLEGVGEVHSQAAEELFKTPLALANSSVEEWLAVPGIGPKTARSIIAEIEGR